LQYLSDKITDSSDTKAANSFPDKVRLLLLQELASVKNKSAIGIKKSCEISQPNIYSMQMEDSLSLERISGNGSQMINTDMR
jgi:hypothetical protein